MEEKEEERTVKDNGRLKQYFFKAKMLIAFAARKYMFLAFYGAGAAVVAAAAVAAAVAAAGVADAVAVARVAGAAAGG